MKPKKEIRLYNVILPIWMLWIVPPLWLIILPANFIIDFTVFYFTLKFMKLDNRFETGKKAILRIWLCGHYRTVSVLYTADLLKRIRRYIKVLEKQAATSSRILLLISKDNYS